MTSPLQRENRWAFTVSSVLHVLCSLPDALCQPARDGIRLSISRRNSPPPYARHLKQFLDLKRVNCVLDVGAFGGGFASVLRSSGFEGPIISFEPVPSSYVLLQQHMGHDPLWSGYQYGLSDKSGESSQITPEFDGDFSAGMTGH